MECPYCKTENPLYLSEKRLDDVLKVTWRCTKCSKMWLSLRNTEEEPIHLPSRRGPPEKAERNALIIELINQGDNFRHVGFLFGVSGQRAEQIYKRYSERKERAGA